MGDEPVTDSQVYRVGTHLLIIVGAFASFFAALGIVIGVRRGDWTFLALVAGVAAALFLLLHVLRLEVRPDGFKYRNLSGSRQLLFRDVRRAYIEVVRADVAPQGAGVFWVERRDGRRVKVNLRTFPIQAAASLFTALESHGIPIEVPDLWAARRLADQVRAEQERMRR